MSETKVPAIPAPTDANLREVARAIKGVLDVREGLLGDPLDSNVKFRDLVDGGVVNVSTVRRGSASSVVITGPIAAGSDGYDPTTDLTPPPIPTGFTATGLFAAVLLQWDGPPATYPNHAYTEIWRASPTFTNATPPVETAPVIGNAVLVGTTATRLFTDYLGSNEIRYYWIRHVSQADVKGPYNGTPGTRAQTATNPELLLPSLANQISTGQLATSLNNRINLIDGSMSLPGSVNERINTSQNAVTALVTVPAYDAGKAYAKGELATYNGSLYKATTTTQGNLPTDTSKWKVVGQYSSLANSFSAVFTDYLTTTETNSAISSATNGLVSTTALNTALGSYVTTSTLTNDYYTKTGTDGAISSATQNLVSNTGLSTALADYTTTANLTANYYTKTATDSAISSATQNLVSTTGLSNTLSNYVTSAALTTNYYTQTQTNTAISNATTNLVSQTTLNNTLSGYATTSSLTTNYYTKTDTDSAIASASQTLVARYGELDATQSWNFSGAVEGFTASGATLVSQGQWIRLTSTGGDPILSSPTVSIDGSKFTLVRARVRRVAGSGWQGDLFYSTAGHGASINYRKNIANTTALNEWRLLEWDMADLTAGGSDWTSSTVTQLRFDLGATVDDVFDIDWIAVGRLGVGAYSSAIQTLATTTAGPDGATAQYTVKIDQGGHVTGYGLSSTANNATPLSEFGVRADRFWIAPPTFVSPSAPTTGLYKGYVWRDTGVNPAVTRYWSGTAWTTTPQNLPFVVLTAGGTINGVSVPAGVYIDTALIGSATITSAQIKDLRADKITAGYTTSVDLESSKFVGSELYLGGTVTYKKDDPADPNLKTGVDSVSNPDISLKTTGAEFNVSHFKIKTSASANADTVFDVVGNAVVMKKAVVGTVDATQIDSRGLSIKDANGNIILAAGSPLAASNITPAAGWLNSNVTLGGLGYTGDTNATFGASASNFSGRVGGGNLVGNSGFKRITGTLGASGSFPVGWGTYNWAGGSITYSVNSGGMFGTNYVRMTVGVNHSSIAGIYVSNTAEKVVDWALGEWFSISFWARAGNSLAVGYKMTPANSNMGWTEGPYDVANPGLSTSWQQYIYRARPGNYSNALSLGELFLSWTVTGSPSGTLPAGAIIDFCAVQVERGDVATAWAEALREKVGGDNPVTASNISTYIEAAAIGSLDIATTGKVRSGKTSYGSGTGWLLEYNGGTPRFDIGTSDQYMRWTGSALEIKTEAKNLITTGLQSVYVTAGGYKTSGTASGDIKFKSNGEVQTSTNGGTYTLDSNWFSPSTTSIGSSYYIRFTKLSGLTPTGETLNTWLQLNVDRTLSLSRSTTGASNASLAYEVSNSSTGSPVLSSGYLDFNVEVGT